MSLPPKTDAATYWSQRIKFGLEQRLIFLYPNWMPGNGIDDLFQPVTSFQDCLPGNVTPITPKQIEQIKDNLLIGGSALALVRVLRGYEESPCNI